jgi:hypothetical protein
MRAARIFKTLLRNSDSQSLFRSSWRSRHAFERADSHAPDCRVQLRAELLASWRIQVESESPWAQRFTKLCISDVRDCEDWSIVLGGGS